MIYHIDELRKAWNAGKKFKFLFFWGHTPEADGSIGPSCFSQWWPCHFIIEETQYCCAEQYMMASKARMFQDEEMLAKIMGTSYPKEMKAYGRAVADFDKEQWDSQCYEIVKQANLAKFGQNSELLAYLLATNSRILVEASPRDRIWGIGMGKRNPDAENPMKWRGRNQLGFALTEARDLLQKKEWE